MITALILDFDGLIVDTETPAYESWRQVYAEHGQELGLELWLGSLGTNHGFDSLAHLLDLIVAADPQARPDHAALAERRRMLKHELSRGRPLLPGVMSLLDQAGAAGMPCAVASSSSRRWVEGWLVEHAILERFVCTRTADDVVLTKPAPDLFLQAAECLGRPPAECLVFEDSPNGILAARAAGMRVVAVPGPVARLAALPPADLRLASLEAMSLTEILAMVN
jgi:HAD superfamily hydrolase (TIGR01509 family)